jgi:hypothetical protein
MYKLGQYVRTKNHQTLGRISDKHHFFADVNQDEDWFDMQVPMLDESTKSENWYSILCKGGGAIVVPESQIEERLLPFKLENVWEDNYFEFVIQ